MYAKNSDKGVIYLKHNKDKTVVQVMRYDGRTAKSCMSSPESMTAI